MKCNCFWSHSYLTHWNKKERPLPNGGLPLRRLSLGYKNTATSPRTPTRCKDIKDMITASSVFKVRHLVSRCRGGWRFTCSCLRGNHVTGDSGGLGHHGDSSLLSGGGLVLLRYFLRAKVEPWGVKAERPRDISLTCHLPLPLGLRRTLGGYLEEACRGGDKQVGRRKEARIGKDERLGNHDRKET